MIEPHLQVVGWGVIELPGHRKRYREAVEAANLLVARANDAAAAEASPLSPTPAPAVATVDEHAWNRDAAVPIGDVAGETESSKPVAEPTPEGTLFDAMPVETAAPSPGPHEPEVVEWAEPMDSGYRGAVLKLRQALGRRPAVDLLVRIRSGQGLEEPLVTVALADRAAAVPVDVAWTVAQGSRWRLGHVRRKNSRSTVARGVVRKDTFPEEVFLKKAITFVSLETLKPHDPMIVRVPHEHEARKVD